MTGGQVVRKRLVAGCVCQVQGWLPIASPRRTPSNFLVFLVADCQSGR
jgi:hypothetical protein